MHLDRLLVAAGLLLLSAPATATPKNILLSDVESLTFRAGKRTTHRRVPAIPQLTCSASPSSICNIHTIDVMRCTNAGAGYDAQDIQWSCTAELPPEVRLGTTDVVCEGYANRDDPYVLRGSCGVRYQLLLTEYGAQRYPDLARKSPGSTASRRSGWWLVGLLGLLVGWLFFSTRDVTGGRDGRTRWTSWRGPHGGGGPGDGPSGGGGGGSGGWDSPPPPYYPKTSDQQWRPGFWSGVAAGGAAGYAASQINNRNEGYGQAGPSRRQSPPSSRTTSSARYQSTSYGSTSRR